MPWIESAQCEWVPDWLRVGFLRVFGLRASPKLLVGVCSIQLFVLLMGMLQQINRIECRIAVPAGGPVVVECDTCVHRSLTPRAMIIHLGGIGIIGSGICAVVYRDQRLLSIYGSAMLFFSLVVGLVAMITALEGPVLEVAVSGISQLDDECIELGERMLRNARDHATLASLGCLVDTMGAVLAIRSKELFSYEEIASQHAEVNAAQAL